MFRILPRDEEFFNLFEKAGQNIQEGAALLKEMLDTFENIAEYANRIGEIEHRGDTFTHDIIRKLNTTFVTPIDREDILQLASSLDDVIDLIHGVAKRFVMYKVDKTTPQAKELGYLIVKSVREINKAIAKLSKDMGEVSEHCVEINSIENEADRVCRDAIADLFENEKDPIAVIKWKEVYETLESATDAAEDVANVLEGVALKNA